MITSIIFSKDRALQLDLTLRSIKHNFSESSDIVVLYKVSDHTHGFSYEILEKEYPEVTFEKQSDDEWGLFGDIERLIAHSLQDYICFFTDDNIVYKKVNLAGSNLSNIFENQMSCLSLRLGLNTNLRDYGDGIPRADCLPQLDLREPFLVWNRTSIPVGGYWSYPLSVDGHIFQKDTIRSFAKELNILNHALQWKQTPNEFESTLQRFWFDLPPMMSSFRQSCVVNSPNNRVQTTTENWHGRKFSFDAESLRDKFLDGRRIRLDKINFRNIACAHQELDILEAVV